jgi:hypothetical protein
LVLGAAGKWNRFEQQLRRLERDWRDVLVVGGLADEDWPARLAAELPGGADNGQVPDTARAEASRGEARTSGQARGPRRDASAPRRIPVGRPRRASPR